MLKEGRPTTGCPLVIYEEYLVDVCDQALVLLLKNNEIVMLSLSKYDLINYRVLVFDELRLTELRIHLVCKNGFFRQFINFEVIS